ncbi:MAG: Blue-light-activated protein [candidate division BRC1 bacterium ADurb.BinA364]|nr:MAG: Blue-light-activated protein [candidate division BRC1 bacterium ADurb.BinA364]
MDWYPWGEEALQAAREQDKPILLSVGYSACHWCHVMERESFEDETTAAYMNEHFPRIYRTAREKLQESDAFFDVVYENPEFRAAIKKRVLEDCASGDPDRMRWDDIPIERAGEETTYISARNVMIPASGLMISAVWDVTDRKRAEEALARSEQRHRTLFESAPDAIFIQTDGRFAYLNAACAHLFGAESAAEMLGRPVLDWFHGKYRESVRQRIRTLNEERRQVPLAEEAIMTLKGETVPVEVAAVPFETDGKNGALVFMRDIRYRKQAEAERERLLSAIEQAEEIVVIAAADATIQYVNPAFERISGFSRAEAVGQTPRILKSGKHDNAYYAQMWRTLTSGQTWRGRFVNKRKDGALFTEEATISPVRDANGQIVNYVAVKRDVTRELELEQQLRQAQRMEAVGRLAGGVAHDFNNMLSVILGHADMALETIPETDPLREDILEIQKAGDRSAALVRQLLAFARKQTIAPKRLDLNDTIGGMLKMLSRLIGEDIDLLWKPSMDLWPVKMDPTQIDQILANLVVNSRDAIAEVGKISIETANVQFDEEYCARHAGFVPGCYVMLAVSDDGSGMEKEMLTSIFDPFFTTKPHGKGTGLGLATVYGIVKQNEGFINVYSEPGKGTTFRIYFPRLREENFTPEETLPQAGVRSGTETVLLVEDEKQLLRFATRLLQDLGYTVLASDTPREALRLAREYPGQIDLLISDVVMPEMSGRDMWNELLAVRPGLKCLFMSGYTANAIAHRGVLDEGVHFLQKPFTRQALASKVRETLEA